MCGGAELLSTFQADPPFGIPCLKSSALLGGQLIVLMAVTIECSNLEL